MRNGTMDVMPQQGGLVRTGVDGSVELSVQAEVQAAALAAQAEADVKARWAIAQRSPRNIDTVRQRLLSECKRPGFAETARYAKPVGKDKVTGPSIRFVEAALRCMGNVYCPTRVIREDTLSRIVEVVVTDLEANTSWPRQITIRKTVERRGDKGGGAPKDRQVVSERLNSYGDRVYEVIATEDELLNKEASAISKAIRTAGLRIIPGDLVDESMRVCVQVQEEKARGELKADPVTTRKRLVDAFVALGVRPEALVEYLGHGLEDMTPPEVADLREVHNAIRDGESKWADVIEHRRGERATEERAEKAVAVPKTSAPPPSQSVPPPPSPSSSPIAATVVADSPPGDPGAAFLEDILLSELPSCATQRDCDGVTRRAEALQGQARETVGKAINARRNEIRGAR